LKIAHLFHNLRNFFLY